MKNIFKATNLPALIMGTGGLGLLLRVWLMSSGIDDKGFLVGSHPANILLWLLVAAVLVMLLLLTKNLVAAPNYDFNFPKSTTSSRGIYLAALGMGFGSFVDAFTVTTGIEILTTVMGLVATLMLVLSGYYRRRGQVPSMLTHIVISIYLMLRLINYYRTWSSDPQIMDYCFPLLATACLMLAAYHRASFDVNVGRRRPYAFFNLAAVFFSCLSMVGWGNIMFYMSASVWMITDLCSLIPMPGIKPLQFQQEEEEC